ncbi:MAG: hypothetical protein ACLPI9_05540, partial [Halobacteriota archaeon]
SLSLNRFTLPAVLACKSLLRKDPLAVHQSEIRGLEHLAQAFPRVSEEAETGKRANGPAR